MASHPRRRACRRLENRFVARAFRPMFRAYPASTECRMTLHDVSLADRFDLSQRSVLLGGVQALVRLMLMQKARDAAAGLATAGYATGYRGSPLGAVDQQMWKARAELAAADVSSSPASTRISPPPRSGAASRSRCAARAGCRGSSASGTARVPGVDRCGDVFRHANMAGTADLGGVIACMGDDHTGESSTTLHQSDFAMVDAMMPILSPAGVQEILDYGIYGWALSRYSGCWVGLKCVKDTVEVTEVVDGDPHRLRIATPADFAMPEGGLNIRLGDTPAAQEARMHDHKRFAAEAFARANRLDRRVWGDAQARIGIVSCGKSWLDTVHALDLLGLDAAEAGAPRDHHLQGRHGLAPRHGELPRLGAGAGADHRRRGKAQAGRGADQGGALRRPRRPARRRLEGRTRRDAVPGQGRARSGADRPQPRRADGAGGRGLRGAGRPPFPARRGAAGRQRRGDRGAPALVLLGLPAQHLDPAARGRPRLCRHRLPLHGAVDGARHRGLHPHGRRGRQLDRRGAVLDPRPCLPEPRRRHLQPLRASRRSAPPSRPGSTSPTRSSSTTRSP